MADELVTAISDLEELKVADLVEKRLQQGEDAFAVLASCQEGMKLVGERFDSLALRLRDYGYVLEVRAVILQGDMEELRENEIINKAYLGE